MDNNTLEASSSPPASSSPSNHIGVSVPDLNKAVKWYHEVLGFNIVTEPMEGSDDNSHILQIDSIMDNAAFKMMLLSIRSDSNNNNLSLPSQSNISTKEQPKSYDNNNNEDQDYFI